MSDTDDRDTLLANVVDAFTKDVEEGLAPTIVDYQTRYPELAQLLGVLLPAVGTLRSRSEELEPVVLPERIDRFRIVRELARGGMGIVLEAFQEPLERLVALKLVQADAADPGRDERFFQEGRLVAKLRHPNVVIAYDAGSWKEYRYLALELLDGTDLRREVERRGPLSLADAVDVMLQATDGLAHAHAAGIIHRDVKPSNLFRTTNGVVKILDLGLGLLRDSSSEPERGLTATNDVLGTFDYMAPEQLRNSREVSARTDVYGLGCTFFYLLTGKILREHMPDAEAVLIAQLGAASGRRIAELVSSMTALDPARRPADMAAVNNQLETLPVDDVDAPDSASQPPGDATHDRRHEATVVEKRPRGSTSVKRWLVPCAVIAGAIGLLYVMRSQEGDSSENLAPQEIAVGGDRDFRDKSGMAFVRLESGEFLMGLSAAEAAAFLASGEKNFGVTASTWELPQRRVRITRPFLLGKYEVSVEQFREFVERTDYVTDAERSESGGMGWDAEIKGPVSDRKFTWRNAGWPQSEDHPVVNVSWNDAVSFCRWKSGQESAVYRLPTEAEWEYACADDRQGRINVLQAPGDDFVFTAPVGTFPANKHGLFDMRGNVWEWCLDWFAPEYDPVDVTDPQGPPTGEQKVARGGSWNSSRFMTRPTCRTSNSHPAAVSYGTGFRVVREP